MRFEVLASAALTPLQWMLIVFGWLVVGAFCVAVAFGITFVGRKLHGWDEDGKNRMQVAAMAGVLVIAAFFGFFCVYGAVPAGAPVLDLCALGLTAGGALIGFLFGVPKSLAAAQTSPAVSTTSGTTAAATVGGPSLQVNTNLDKVSDWLTTIVTGLALTQLVKIPGYANRSPTSSQRISRARNMRTCWRSQCCCTFRCSASLRRTLHAGHPLARVQARRRVAFGLRKRTKSRRLQRRRALPGDAAALRRS